MTKMGMILTQLQRRSTESSIPRFWTIYCKSERPTGASVRLAGQDLTSGVASIKERRQSSSLRSQDDGAGNVGIRCLREKKS